MLLFPQTHNASGDKWESGVAASDYLGPRELGTVMAWVAMKIQTGRTGLLRTCCEPGMTARSSKKIFSIEEGAQFEAAFLWSELPQAFAGQILGCDFFCEGLVVAAQVLGQGVCHDLIHIDADAAHGGTFRRLPGAGDFGFTQRGIVRLGDLAGGVKAGSQ